MKIQRLLTVVFMLMGLILQSARAEQIAGWIEWAKLDNYDIKFKAKLDTGAKTSSINAEDLKLFEKNGRQYARFSVTNSAGQSVTIEEPVNHTAVIKRHFDKKQERPVINLKICIGEISKMTEVNLVDRRGLNYQLLIGRSYLAGDLLIDSKAVFLISLQCKQEQTIRQQPGDRCLDSRFGQTVGIGNAQLPADGNRIRGCRSGSRPGIESLESQTQSLTGAQHPDR